MKDLPARAGDYSLKEVVTFTFRSPNFAPPCSVLQVCNSSLFRMASPASLRSGRKTFLSTNCAFLAGILALILVSMLVAGLALIPSSNLRQTIAADLKFDDPLLARFNLINHQAEEHAALVNAYGAYTIRQKIAASRRLKILEKFVDVFSSIAERETSDATANDTVLAIEKELKKAEKSYRKFFLEQREKIDSRLKIQKLCDTIFATDLQLQHARKSEKFSSSVAARSTPKSLHCLNLRLMQESLDGPIRDPSSDYTDSDDRYHYVIISDNVIAAAVVVNSAANSASEPSKHFFHLITDQMHLAAFQIWFNRRPPPLGAKIEIRCDFSRPLEHLKFYLPDIYPRLKRIILLEDDVVVQKDMVEIWSTDLEGNVNGAVEICFGPFRRFSRYLNFSHHAVPGKFSPRKCAWAHGVNLFDLSAWRDQNLTSRFEFYNNLNSDGTLWRRGSVAAELMTFDGSTRPLEREWNVLGLGRNPRVSTADIAAAGAVHFAGAMKPWLDVAMKQYKGLWTRHLPADDRLLQLCNLGL